MGTQDEDLAASISALKNAVTGLANSVKELRAEMMSELSVVKANQAQMPDILIELQRRVSGASE